jgi:hypothetical protein
MELAMSRATSIVAAVDSLQVRARVEAGFPADGAAAR